MELGCIEDNNLIAHYLFTTVWVFTTPSSHSKKFMYKQSVADFKVSKAPKWNTSDINFRQKVKYVLGFGVGRGVEVKFVRVVHHAGVLSAWFL